MSNSPASSSKSGRIVSVARQLAALFTEDAYLPTRYKKQSVSLSRNRKGKEDSEVEKRFKATTELWSIVIETMLARIESDQAWRFITLKPRAAEKIDRVTRNKDFCDLIDYMALRRDKEACSPDELGCLAVLSVAFQREVEKSIES